MSNIELRHPKPLTDALIDNDTVRTFLLQQWDGQTLSDADIRQALDCCERVGNYFREESEKRQEESK